MKKQMAPFSPNPLPAAGKAVYSSPELAGLSIHRIILTLGGGAFTKAMITNVQAKLGGKIVLDGVSGTQLDQMNFKDTNQQEDANHLSIWCGIPDGADYYSKHASDWDLSAIRGPGGTNPILEINITYAGATTPTLAANAIYTLPKKTMPARFNKGEGNLIKAVVTSVLTPNAAVVRQQNNPNIGQQAKASILRAYLFHTGHLTSLQVLKDGVVTHDDVSQTDNDSEQLIYNHPTIANLYAYDPLTDHSIGKAEDTLKSPHNAAGAVNLDAGSPASYSWRLTTNAADVITTPVSMLVPFDTFAGS